MNEPRLVGYARVSTEDQELNLQIDALQRQNIAHEDIFTDKQSGSKADRPGLRRCLDSLHQGDTLVVWRLDRLGRSMQHLVALINELRERRIGFRSICDGVIDTTSASGELVFTLFSALAQFERRLIQERTRAGLAAARARGRQGGRRPLPADTPRIVLAGKLFLDKTVTIKQICETLHVSRTTLYRYLKMRRGAESRKLPVGDAPSHSTGPRESDGAPPLEPRQRDSIRRTMAHRPDDGCAENPRIWER